MSFAVYTACLSRDPLRDTEQTVQPLGHLRLYPGGDRYLFNVRAPQIISKAPPLEPVQVRAGICLSVGPSVRLFLRSSVRRLTACLSLCLLFCSLSVFQWNFIPLVTRNPFPKEWSDKFKIQTLWVLRKKNLWLYYTLQLCRQLFGKCTFFKHLQYKI